MINNYFIFLSILGISALLFSGIFGHNHKSKLSNPNRWINGSRLFGGIIFLIFILIMPLMENPLSDLILKDIFIFGLIVSIIMIFGGSEIISFRNIHNHPIYYYIAKIEYYLGWVLLAVTGIIFIYCKIKGI